MFRRLSAIFLVAGWFCASGALLQVVQVYAWARMFSGYAQTCSVAEAAERTFDPAHPCPLCRALQRVSQESRRHQAPAETQAPAGKMLLICHKAEPAVFGVSKEAWRFADGRPQPAPVLKVPVPPPRLAA